MRCVSFVYYKGMGKCCVTRWCLKIRGKGEENRDLASLELIEGFIVPLLVISNRSLLYR